MDGPPEKKREKEPPFSAFYGATPTSADQGRAENTGRGASLARLEKERKTSIG